MDLYNFGFVAEQLFELLLANGSTQDWLEWLCWKYRLSIQWRIQLIQYHLTFMDLTTKK